MKIRYSKLWGAPKKIIFGLYGAGGSAREVMYFANEYFSIFARQNSIAAYQIFFIETAPQKKEVNGYPLIAESEFFQIECSARYFNIAIGDSKARERIANNCLAQGGQALTVKSAQSLNYGDNEIGEGAILCANTMILPNVKIGKFFHANYYSSIAHDCVIGDFVTFAPNVRCNGNVHIHDHAYIGASAVIKQGSLDKPLVIGEGAIVGMGAVVTKDVPPFTTVVGNPARPLIKT